MSETANIISIITALGLFAKVRYLVAEADSENDPTSLPLCILSDGGKDYTELKTFCGQDLFIQTYDMLIIAQTSSELASLTEAVSIALKGIIGIDEVVEVYDPDLRAFSADISWS